MRNKNKKAGFTVVEIMTVVTVIGILSAVMIFSVGNWRTRTAQAEVSSDLNAVVSAMEAARNFSSGYPATIPSTFRASQNVTVTLRSSTATTYCIEAASKVVTSVIYKVTNADKEPTAGTC